MFFINPYNKLQSMILVEKSLFRQFNQMVNLLHVFQVIYTNHNSYIIDKFQLIALLLSPLFHMVVNFKYLKYFHRFTIYKS